MGNLYLWGLSDYSFVGSWYYGCGAGLWVIWGGFLEEEVGPGAFFSGAERGCWGW